MAKSAYKKVLLKLSGEMLLGSKEKGIDFDVTEKLAQTVKNLHDQDVQIAIVLGAGNIWRFRDSQDSQLPRVMSDQMGMLGTIMNGMAFGGTLSRLGTPATVFSAIEMSEICEPYSVKHAKEAMEAGNVVILAGGTGNPFFTTDSAAALRALEMECDALLKGTKVDGVFDSDPAKNPDAKMYDTVTYTEVLEKDLKVMDAAAISLCRDNKMPLRVFSIQDFANIEKVVNGEAIGTTVVAE